MLKNTICNVVIILMGIAIFISIAYGMVPLNTRALTALAAACLCIVGLTELIRDTWAYYTACKADEDLEAFSASLRQVPYVPYDYSPLAHPDQRQQELLAIMQDIFPGVDVTIIPVDKNKLN